ncbi:hypothetical protein BGX30_002370 [Mortierella sp. GBA39]|nr:hypothetical protein BGX30_002370 [Mortierella sp. GBA39]
MDSPSASANNDSIKPSYFDIAKPISIPNNTPGRINTDVCRMLANEDMDENALPEFLQSFQDAGISDTRLRQFTWLHPKNYSSDGSLSDDYILSPYGTSVSSPRGDEWEIIDSGPRKSIDELWDEVFEYKERIKILERAHQQAQEDTSLQAQLDACNDYVVRDDDNDESQTPTSASTSTSTAAGIGGMGAMTQVDKAVVYASRKGVVVILNGRYAGKKAVVGSKERGYGHAIVAGVERYPLKITKNMGKKRIAKRSKVKPFIKVINYNHMMPTRYGLELENLKSVLTVDSFKEPSQREEAKKAIKKLFEERYNSGKNKWFFSKLRF